MCHHVHIMVLDLRYNWPAVYTYDMQFRSKKACQLDLHFRSLDRDLMLTIYHQTRFQRNLVHVIGARASSTLLRIAPFARRTRWRPVHREEK